MRFNNNHLLVFECRSIKPSHRYKYYSCVNPNYSALCRNGKLFCWNKFNGRSTAIHLSTCPFPALRFQSTNPVPIDDLPFPSRDRKHKRTVSFLFLGSSSTFHRLPHCRFINCLAGMEHVLTRVDSILVHLYSFSFATYMNDQ